MIPHAPAHQKVLAVLDYAMRVIKGAPATRGDDKIGPDETRMTDRRIGQLYEEMFGNRTNFGRRTIQYGLKYLCTRIDKPDGKALKPKLFDRIRSKGRRIITRLYTVKKAAPRRPPTKKVPLQPLVPPAVQPPPQPKEECSPADLAAGAAMLADVLKASVGRVREGLNAALEAQADDDVLKAPVGRLREGLNAAVQAQADGMVIADADRIQMAEENRRKNLAALARMRKDRGEQDRAELQRRPEEPESPSMPGPQRE
jgi:hypothetical protein